MKGHEMREIRDRLQLDRLRFARLIGYTGTDRNDVMRIRKYENDRQQVPLYIARLVWLLDHWASEAIAIGCPPPELTPTFPEWPGYEFDHTPDHELEDDDAA